MQRLPHDATHLILSVGGNDALMRSEILHAPVRSTSEALCLFADIAARFEEHYRLAVDACRRATLPLCLCTIYNGCFADPSFQRTVTMALTIFNDAILRVGFELRLPMIDLRFVCSCPADLANPIEPSSIGGARIARALVNVLSGAKGDMCPARVFVDH